VIVAFDVHYGERSARVGCVGFHAWDEAAPAFERAVAVPGAPAPYEPGNFYLRELPALLAAVRALPERPAVIVVDAYVSLGARPGLGGHLFEALDRAVPVIGVAKSEFHGSSAARVVRGASKKPLFVSAAGIPQDIAAAHVRAMHGAHRVPTLLARADRLARGA
jgi:deoxyribonuclease V